METLCVNRFGGCHASLAMMVSVDVLASSRSVNFFSGRSLNQVSNASFQIGKNGGDRISGRLN